MVTNNEAHESGLRRPPMSPAKREDYTLYDLTSRLKAVPNDEMLPPSFRGIKSNQIYRFNGSIIHYKEDLYICAYRMMITAKSHLYKHSYLPSMWTSLIQKVYFVDKKYKEELQHDIKYMDNSNIYIGDEDYLESYSNDIRPRKINTSWGGLHFIGMAMFKINNGEIDVLSDQVINDPALKEKWTVGVEDPRLYRKSDGEIYLYYMMYSSPNIISCFDNPDDSNVRCLYVVESPVVVVNDLHFEVKFIQNTNRPELSIPISGKVLCYKSQLDHQGVNNNFPMVFDKNYGPFVYKGKDYFIYALMPFQIYEYYPKQLPEYLTEYPFSMDCEKVLDMNIPFFSNLKALYKSLSVSNDVVAYITPYIRSISGNTPAIPYLTSKKNTSEYIVVGHMRLNINNDKTLPYVKDFEEALNYAGINTNLIEIMQRELQGDIAMHNDMYFMFFYTFDPSDNFKIKRITNSFIVNHPNNRFTLNFAESLIHDDLGGAYCLTYGEGDAALRMLKISDEEMENMLIDIDTFNPADYSFNFLNFTKEEIEPVGDLLINYETAVYTSMYPIIKFV